MTTVLTKTRIAYCLFSFVCVMFGCCCTALWSYFVQSGFFFVLFLLNIIVNYFFFLMFLDLTVEMDAVQFNCLKGSIGGLFWQCYYTYCLSLSFIWCNLFLNDLFSSSFRAGFQIFIGNKFWSNEIFWQNFITTGGKLSVRFGFLNSPIFFEIFHRKMKIIAKTFLDKITFPTYIVAWIIIWDRSCWGAKKMSNTN